MENPLISVIIPCHNCAGTVITALDSMLSQTYKNLEIIVVDDNSADNLREVLVPYLNKHRNIRYVKANEPDPYRLNSRGININAGYSARNCGIKYAKGEYITFQDADDASFSDRIEVQLRTMQKYGAVHAVVDFCKFKDERVGKMLGIEPKDSDITMPDKIAERAKNNPPVPAWLRDPYSKHSTQNPLVVLAKKIGRKLFWKEIEPYPCTGGSAMVKKEVFDKIKFRPLWERTRPSKKGRGADMDFNYAVAETFKKSIAINLPLYLWRYPKEEDNPKYNMSKFKL